MKLSHLDHVPLPFLVSVDTSELIERETHIELLILTEPHQAQYKQFMYPACPKKVIKPPVQDLAVLYKLQQQTQNASPTSPLDSTSTSLKRQASRESSENKRHKTADK